MPYKRKITVFLLIIFVAVSLAAVSCSAEDSKGFFSRMWDKVKAWRSRITPGKAPEEAGKAPGEKPLEKPSKEEMLKIIKSRLEVFPEIVDMIPGLTAKEDADGKKSYYYTSLDIGTVAIDDLDPDMLYELYVSVNNKATIMNTERINRIIRQQEQIRQLQNLQRQTAPSRPGGTQPPPQPPQPPKLPPQPPRR